MRGHSKAPSIRALILFMGVPHLTTWSPPKWSFLKNSVNVGLKFNILLSRGYIQFMTVKDAFGARTSTFLPSQLPWHVFVYIDTCVATVR